MARFDRCIICDYSEASGSSIMGLNPGANGKVRRHDDDLRCDRCQSEITQAAFDMKPPAEVDEELIPLED